MKRMVASADLKMDVQRSSSRRVREELHGLAQSLMQTDRPHRLLRRVLWSPQDAGQKQKAGLRVRFFFVAG